MDIRRYLVGGAKQSSGHNTRKQVANSLSQESQTPTKDAKATKKSEREKKSAGKSSKSSKRRRVAYISDSSDDDVEFVKDDNVTPNKKLKTDTPTAGIRSSPRQKPASRTPVKKEEKKRVQSSAADFFGSKVVKVGSKDVPKSIAAKLADVASKASFSKAASKANSSKTAKLNTKETNHELVILDDEVWSDDDSFAQLLDSGSHKSEGHVDAKFNKALDQLDTLKSSTKSHTNKDSPQKGKPERSSKRTPSKSSPEKPMSKSRSKSPTKRRQKYKELPLIEAKKSHNEDVAKSDNEEKASKAKGSGDSLNILSNLTASKKNNATPKKKDATPKKCDETAKKGRVTPKKIDATPEKRKATPKTTDTASKTKDTTPIKTGTTPKKSNAAPKKSSATPKKSGATPKTKDLIGNDKDSSLKNVTSEREHKKIDDSDATKGEATTSKKVKQASVSGKTFVITGQLENLERDDAKDLIVKHGGRVVSAISGKVNYLVAGEEAGVSKMAKAEKVAGLKIINESELHELLGTSNEVPQDDSMDIDTLSDVKQTDTSTKGQPLSPISRQLNEQTPKLHIGSSKEPRDASQDLLWVEKYKPVAMNKIIGQMGEQSNANKLLRWLNNWHRHRKLGTKPVSGFGGFGRGDPTGGGFKAALLSGPPGIGKTTSAVLVCKEAGYSFFEMNASDSRSKKILQETVGQALGNTTMVDFMGDRSENKTNNKKHCIVMDEVDGMAGNEDRGGIQELIQLIKGSHIPLICICNDRQSQKIRSLANHCFDLRFQRPRVEQIKAAMKTVCFKEGISIDGNSLNDIIQSSNHDIRQILHNLSVWSASGKNFQGGQVKDDSDKAKKDFKIDAFTACRLAFSESETAKMSLRDKSDLFFYDYSLHPLFVQENYIHASPHAARKSDKEKLKMLAKASNSIAMGDVISKSIRSRGGWGLLPMQAMFSSVLPAEAVMGHLSKQIDFPKWLGKFSTTNKNFRLNREISIHMGLNVTGSSQHICLDYLPILRDRLTLPLIKEEPADGVKQVIGLLEQYDLLKDDYDNLLELTQWPGQRDLRTLIESKTKAALTRQYNKSSHKLHYAVAVGPVKRKRGQATPDSVEAEEDDSGNDSDEDVIKALKVPPKKAAARTKATAAKSKPATEKKPRARGGKKK